MKKWFTKNKICWKLMKICAAQVMIATLSVSLSIAHDNYSQLLEKKVTIDLTEVTLQDALLQLEQTTSVKIFYTHDPVLVNSKVSIHATDNTLHAVLDELLAPYQYTYKVNEKFKAVVLKRSRPTSSPDQPNPPKSMRTNEVIKGRVTDAASSLPLPGVNIVVKGTTNGTTTNEQGDFNLEVDGNALLVFSFIGYTTVEERVGDRTLINVSLTQDIASLTEVTVNAGYWDVNKREQTGNISKVTATEIQKQPISNPLSALEGRMPGVYISESSGIPGAGVNIQVRGQNSLRNTFANNGNLPFYVIDGVPFTPTTLGSDFLNLQNGSPLIAINPSDIESIEILKDADATAIYGSRGANGVVLITTKKGHAGKTKVDVTLSQGIGKVASKMDLLNTQQYIEMRNEGFANDKIKPGVTDYDVNGTWSQDRYTDFQKQLIGGTAAQTNMQASISGGNANTQYILAGALFKQSTVFPGSTGLTRGSARVDLNNTSDNKKFNINVSATYNLSNNNLNSDFTFSALTLAPNAPSLYNEDGSLNWENNTFSNPLANLEIKYRNNTSNLVTNGSVRYTIIPGLNVKATVGYNQLITTESQTNPISRFNPSIQASQTGNSIFGDGTGHTWIAEPQMEYKKSISRGLLTVLVGSTFQSSTTERQTLNATGYTNDALLDNVRAATAISVLGYDYSQYKYNAVFGRINYNWSEKYLINLTARRDGSSRFGDGQKFANFGAVGAAWIFSNESFVKNTLPVLSFGKLRASFGSTGSDAIGNYQYLDSYSATTYPYNGVTGLAVTRVSNPDYSWETNLKFESALDLGFFNDRVLLSSAFYLNHSSNQLVGLPLPLLTGQSSVQYNLPAIVQNRGVELTLNTVNIQLPNFKWSTSLNLTIPRNTLLEFPDIEKFPAYNNKYVVGKSLYIYKGYEYNGINPTTGAYSFIDQNGDNAINSPNDIVGIKELTQKYFGGISNSFKYKGIQLDIFFQVVNQTGANYTKTFQRPGRMSNQPSVVFDRWQKAGDDAPVQRYSTNTSDASTAFNNYNASDASIVDASFIRLKNVALSWQFPSSWIQTAHIQSGRIFVNAQNLFTFTSYKGLDPETQSSQSLPPLKMITAGLNISF